MELKEPQLPYWSFNELKKRPLVLVTWWDTTSTHADWFDSTKEMTIATVKTPGIILEDNKDFIIIASTVGWHGQEGLLSFDTVIPKGCIDKVTILKKNWWR